MNRITALEFSKLLAEYESYSDSKLMLKPLSKAANRIESVFRVIKQNIHLQSALCELLITGNEAVTLHVPAQAFAGQEYCTVFDNVLLLSVENKIVNFTVRSPKPGIWRAFWNLANAASLHPFLNRSCAYYQEAGPIDSTADIVFFSSETGQDSRSVPEDAFLKSAASWHARAYNSIPAYMPLSDLRDCGLLDQYSSFFDKIVFVGHIENEKIISHAAVCFFDYRK